MAHGKPCGAPPVSSLAAVRQGFRHLPTTRWGAWRRCQTPAACSWCQSPPTFGVSRPPLAPVSDIVRAARRRRARATRQCQSPTWCQTPTACRRDVSRRRHPLAVSVAVRPRCQPSPACSRCQSPPWYQTPVSRRPLAVSDTVRLLPSVSAIVRAPPAKGGRGQRRGVSRRPLAPVSAIVCAPSACCLRCQTSTACPGVSHHLRRPPKAGAGNGRCQTPTARPGVSRRL
jgi:hypothetical protein